MTEPTESVDLDFVFDEAFRSEIADGNTLAEAAVEIRVDGTYLIGGPVGELPDAVVLYARKLLDAIPAVLEGEQQWVGCLALPGGLRVTPVGDGVRLWFGYAESYSPEVPEEGLLVDRDAFAEAVVQATSDLLEVLETENPDVFESRYVQRLEESLEKTNRTLREHDDE